MKKVVTRSILLTLTLLSAWVAQAQTKWPLINQDVYHKIFAGYGNYDWWNDSSHIHFHEGLDLQGDSGRVVVAVEQGIIVERKKNNDYYDFVTVTRGLANDSFALCYMHITIGKHRRKRTTWIVGDTVNIGDTIGTIMTTANIFPHTHFEWDNKEAPGSWSATGAVIPDLQGNPITFLKDRASDAIRPIVYRPIRYRSQSGTYFVASTACGDTVVKTDVDIVAKVREQFGNFTNPNYNLNVLQLYFTVRGFKAADSAQIATQKSFDFTGRFVAAATPNRGRNTYNKFQDAALVHTVYSNDAVCKSVPRDVRGGTDGGIYWYIVTNKDTLNDSLEVRDGDYYWNSKVRKTTGYQWNSRYTDAAHVADSNKNAAFPDGRYVVNVKAHGYGSTNDTASTNDTIFVNNFTEFIHSCDGQGRYKDTFCIGSPVYLKGVGYPKFRSFRVHIIKDTTWTANKPIPTNATRVATATVTADANGRIPVTQIWAAYVPNGKPDKGYDIILDYDGDSLYSIPQLGFTVDTKDDSTGGRGIIGYDSIKVKLKKTNACNGKCNGKIEATITGGKPPYKYQWYMDFCCPIDSTKDIDSLCPGYYSLVVTDSNGCSVTITDTITDGMGMGVSLTPSPACDGECNGQIATAVTGGTPGFDFDWSDGSTDIDRTGLCPGWYALTVTDTNGCQATDSALIMEVDSLVLGAWKQDATCGSCNGFIDLQVAGGIPSFYWTGPGGPYYTEDIYGLCAGHYTVIVSSYGGCSDTLAFDISQPDSLSISWDAQDATCSGTCNGSIDLTVSGGLPPYSYTWYGPSGYMGSGEDLSNLCPGCYTVYISDSGGCFRSELICIGAAGSGPNITVDLVKPDSCHTSVGAIFISVSGGTPSYSYAWTSSGGFSASSQDITNIPAGYYTVVVTDSNGCESMASIMVSDFCLDTAVHDTVIVGKHASAAQTAEDMLYIRAVQPNPFTGSTEIVFTCPDKGTAVFTVTDIQGRVVKKESFEAQRGSNSYLLTNTEHMAKGIYTVNMQLNGQTIHCRIVKQ